MFSSILIGVVGIALAFGLLIGLVLLDERRKDRNARKERSDRADLNGIYDALREWEDDQRRIYGMDPIER